MSKETVYFGIPLISRSAAKNWSHVTQLFNNTLASIYNQSCDNFKVLVACHDIPAIDSAYEDKTEFIQVDSPIPTTPWEMMLDKGIKKHAVVQRLHALGGGYHMFMDADDLVHCDLVDYVLNQQQPNGYVLKYGYEFDQGRNMLRKLNNFDQVCGSCAIVYFYPEDLPSEQDPKIDGYFDQFRNHQLWKQVALQHHRPLAIVPFKAALYVRNTGKNHSARFLKRKLKQKLFFLFGGMSATEEIEKAFCLANGKLCSS